MADITPEEIIAGRSVKYGGDVRIPFLLTLAEEYIGDKIPEVFPRNNSKALLVLHWLTLDDRAEESGATGTILEEKEGELTIKYGSTAHNIMYHTSDLKSFLGQTVWGIELYSYMGRFFVKALTRFS